MRADVALVDAISFAAASWRSSIMLGDLLMPRPAFDVVRRRIGPTSLKHLVEDCPSCGPLGWQRTRGIANCETVPSKFPDPISHPLKPTLSL